MAIPREGASPELAATLAASDLLLDCLPGSQAPRMGRLALEHRLHYANLTEHVAESRELEDMAKGAPTAFVLQCGLAPGFIDVLAHGLFQRFCREFRVDTADRVRLRVGALPRHATPPAYYGFTWSPVGVATEYFEPAVVVRDFKRTHARSLTERATLYLDGTPFEEALTSGGAADLPDALAGRVRSLEYMTLRHPGHYAWVEGLLAGIPEGESRIEHLQARMELTIPHVEDDVVVIYASVKGPDRAGRSRLRECFLKVLPTDVGGRRLRAIQATTAAGLAEVARMLLTSERSGVILQSAIDPAAYLAGPFVTRVYGTGAREAVTG